MRLSIRVASFFVYILGQIAVNIQKGLLTNIGLSLPSYISTYT